jgi:hypothetical protein
MAKKRKTNLDALIPRLDMEAGEYRESSQAPIQEMSHTELEFANNRYQVIRKPDFQRPTTAWTPEKIAELVYAYASGGLVPAIILWRSPQNYLFVIDGAHRLSSLIAWIQDDYGDKERSRSFFTEIPEAQKEIAERTRALVNTAVGPWDRLSSALVKNDLEYIEAARVLTGCTLKVQMLPTKDVIQAENAFFKINEQGEPLSETDRILLHSRRCPNAIAARAVDQRATGHQHWHKFTSVAREQIEKLSKTLYKSLYHPPSISPTIRSPEVPIAGKYVEGSSLGLVLQVINLSNHVSDEIPESTAKAEEIFGADPKGNRTIEYLKQAKQIITTIANQEDTDYMRSLDLHPLVYFYSDRGNHQPLTFQAVIEWIANWKAKSDFIRFTLHREAFEEFLIAHKDFLQQISRDLRGGVKAVHAIKKFLESLLTHTESGVKPDELVDALRASGYTYLKLPTPMKEEEYGKDFTPPTKSQINISRHLTTAWRCEYCRARVPNFGLSFDHSTDRSEGGKGSPENARRTHHYCNSNKKNLIPLFREKDGNRQGA